MSSSAAISGPIDFTKTIDTSNVAGKTILITGGASGIGAAVAQSLAEAGARVTIADLNADAGVAFAAELSVKGLHVQFIQTDVTDWHSQLRAFKASIADCPNRRIDTVIAAAGLNGTPFFQNEPFLSADKGDEPLPPKLDIINVNLIGSYYTACLAIHYFRLQANLNPQTSLRSDNQLIFIASNIAYSPIPLFSNYSASKAGVRALWVSLRNHPHLTDMRTNLVAPHIVRSPMTKPLWSILDGKAIKMTEIEEVVEAITRLVCDESIKGRAVAVHPGDTFDLCDTVEECQGAKEFLARYETQAKPVFDFMGSILEAGVDPAGKIS